MLDHKYYITHLCRYLIKFGSLDCKTSVQNYTGYSKRNQTLDNILPFMVAPMHVVSSQISLLGQVTSRKFMHQR